MHLLVVTVSLINRKSMLLCAFPVYVKASLNLCNPMKQAHCMGAILM